MKTLAQALIPVLVILLAWTSPLFALHAFYEQNGECYLMVGEGDQRAVYALNNLTGAGVTALYDPYDAYGITASQRWDADNNVPLKDLFTFAGTDTGLTPLTGLAPRRVMTEASNNIYDINTVPPFTVHRFHGASNQGPTGRGNHPWGTINSLFSGTDYPCSVIPTDVATMSGYQWIPYGSFYHARDVVVWSNWTYGGATRVDTPPAGESGFNPQTWGVPVWTTKMPPGPWVVCCNGTRPRSGYIRGGWVRRMLRENLSGKFRDLKLYSYRVDSGATTPSFERDVANVLTETTGTIDKNGECCDGCIARVDGETMPGVPSPVLDCVYSAQVDRTYLYRRDFGATAFTLLGQNTDDQLIGDGSDLTCQFLGVSSKSATGNFTYLLGLNQINQWLNDANAPADMLLTDLTDVAVSDQWWQTGGIVYAYDKTKKKVYQFVRNEVGGGNGIPRQINVWDGVSLPDAIGADGFGNLYLMKTNFDPTSTDFAPAQAYTSYYLTTMAGGVNIYRARFRQRVSKGVVKRDYYAGTFTSVPGEVVLGNNEFYRDFIASDPADTSTWVWSGPQGQFAPAVDSDIRTELAVINTTTPPRPENINGSIDCNGPLVSLASGGFNFAVPDAQGYLSDDTDYFFQVENPPYFDANGLNINSVRSDTDGDENIGVFPSTTERTSLLYYWKVVQVKDRYGNSINNVLVDQEGAGQTGTSLYSFPPSPGEFRVGVKARYKYYDYDNLPLGALASAKNSVLSDLRTATGGDADGYSWEDIKIKQVPPPPELEAGVIMSGRPDGSGGHVFRPDSPMDDATIWCSAAEPNPPSVPFVLNGHNFVKYRTDGLTPGDNYTLNQPWAMKLRESSCNLSQNMNRIASITAALPPDPGDDKMIPGTLAWLGDPQFTWKTTLTRDGEVIIDESFTTIEPLLPLEGLRKLFPVPSAPASYALRVEGVRRYSYETYLAQYVNVGGDLERTWVLTTKTDKIAISANANVTLTDHLGPQLTFPNPFHAPLVPGDPASSPAFFAMVPRLYGTTGESLPNVESPPADYAVPTTLDYIIADNNPFGNAVVTASGSDMFHHADNLDLGLIWSHDSNLRGCLFSYTTANCGVMPPTAPLPGENYLLEWYQTGSTEDFKVQSADILTEAEFNTLTGTEGLFNRSFSYRRYWIALPNVCHFSRPLPPGPPPATGTTNSLSATMDTGYANSMGAYQNLNYGIGWQESSGLATSAYRCGHIIIRDNDRPNTFLRLTHEKDPSASFTVPDNINCVPPEWRHYAFGLTEENHNGIETWGDGVDLKTSFNSGFHIVSNGAVTTHFLPAGAPLEIDVPMLVEPLFTDNIMGADGCATMAFYLASGSTVLLDCIPTGGGNPIPMQYIFREPGTYRVVLTIDDTAKDWPTSDPLGNPTLANPLVNRRTLDAIIEVTAFRLDVRIIDRTKQNR